MKSKYAQYFADRKSGKVKDKKAEVKEEKSEPKVNKYAALFASKMKK